MNEHGTPEFLPKPEHLAYLANLLTVMAVLYAAFYVHRERRRRQRGHVPGVTSGWEPIG